MYYLVIQKHSALLILLNMTSESMDIKENQPPMGMSRYHTLKSNNASSDGSVPLINAPIKRMRPVLGEKDQRTEASFSHKGETGFEQGRFLL